MKNKYLIALGRLFMACFSNCKQQDYNLEIPTNSF